MDVQVSTILDLYDKKVIELTRANVLLEAENIALKERLAEKEKEHGETD